MQLFIQLFSESMLFAARALFSHKLRTALSLLGITIGIFAIITVFTVVDSLEKNIRGSVASLGNNVIVVEKWPWAFGPDYPWWRYILRPNATLKDMQVLLKRAKMAEALTIKVDTKKTVHRFSNRVENAVLCGVTSEYNKVAGFTIMRGRFFSDVESGNAKHVAVIGSAIYEALFLGGEDPLGQEIIVSGRKFRVIGVIKKEGESMLGDSKDDMVLIPFSYARNLIDVESENNHPRILIKAKPGIDNDQLKNEVVGILRAERRLTPETEDNFALNETSVLSKGFDGLFDVIGTVGWIIGGFSILVGGFGIANIMFVSVKERTSIIGVQKALGARNDFILLQFLTEAVLLSLAGGALGLGLIWLITALAGDSFGMRFVLSLSNVILGFTVSFLIGLISGFIPAYGASQLDPVDAMRSN